MHLLDKQSLEIPVFVWIGMYFLKINQVSCKKLRTFVISVLFRKSRIKRIAVHVFVQEGKVNPVNCRAHRYMYTHR